MKTVKFLLLSILLITTFSCSKNDDSPSEQEEDVQLLVENFVTPELIATLQQLGFTFRDGIEQPNI